MGKTAGIVIVIALLAAPAAAQKVHVDYDRDAVGREFRSFAWAPTPETSLAICDLSGGDGRAEGLFRRAKTCRRGAWRVSQRDATRRRSRQIRRV